MKKIFSIVIIITSLWLRLSAAVHQPKQEEKSYSGVTTISDDLYVGKVADEFYVAIERVDKSNIDMWKQYARIQWFCGQKFHSKYLPDLGGIEFFKMVLDQYKKGIIKPCNELWIVYASNKPVSSKAQLNVDVFSDKILNPSIEMFCTVITSANALITSHMGMSRTIEAAYDLEQGSTTRKKHSYQSMYVHSFAAEVFQMINPQKRYMLFTPLPLMRSIVLRKMPMNTVFIGDNRYQERLKAVQKDPKILVDESVLTDMKKQKTSLEYGQLVTKIAQQMYDYLACAEKINLLKTNPPRIIKSQQGFIIQKPDKELLVEIFPDTEIYQWLFTRPYQTDGIDIPYILVDLAALAAWGALGNTH